MVLVTPLEHAAKNGFKTGSMAVYQILQNLFKKIHKFYKMFT